MDQTNHPEASDEPKKKQHTDAEKFELGKQIFEKTYKSNGELKRLNRKDALTRMSKRNPHFSSTVGWEYVQQSGAGDILDELGCDRVAEYLCHYLDTVKADAEKEVETALWNVLSQSDRPDAPDLRWKILHHKESGANAGKPLEELQSEAGINIKDYENTSNADSDAVLERLAERIKTSGLPVSTETPEDVRTVVKSLQVRTDQMKTREGEHIAEKLKGHENSSLNLEEVQPGVFRGRSPERKQMRYFIKIPTELTIDQMEMAARVAMSDKPVDTNEPIKRYSMMGPGGYMEKIGGGVFLRFTDKVSPEVLQNSLKQMEKYVDSLKAASAPAADEDQPAKKTTNRKKKE